MARGEENLDVPSATNLPAAPKDDRDERIRKYMISMGIRTLCLPLAVFTSGWVRWAFVAGAVFLPYFAVVLANATNRRRIDVLGSVRPDDQVEHLKRGSK